MTDEARTLLIRAFDARHTYLSFRWLDAPDDAQVHRVDAADIRDLMQRLAGMLPGDDASTIRALRGPLTRSEDERAFARETAELLFPESVRERIAAARVHLDVRLTPSRALAQVPFELLALDGDRRLLEAATVTVEPPAAIHAGRARAPRSWTESASLPVAYVLDPVVPRAERMRSVLTGDDLRAHAATRTWTAHSGKSRVTRWELGDDLRDGARRLLYFGHVSTSLGQPGSSSLHLSDTGSDYGLAAGTTSSHRPLSALDLLVGTAAPHLGPPGILPPEPGLTGPELWPMPPRVAIIACEGGADYRSAETFGLVTAIFNDGAELVTTTRWALPTDHAFQATLAEPLLAGPTTALAIAVDDAHEAADAVGALRGWQLSRLAAWRAEPSPLTSPITWASVASHLCPRRTIAPPEGR